MPITAEERATARMLLVESLAGLRREVDAFSPAQWNFGTEGWSPLLIVEHLYIVETGILRSIPQMPPPDVVREVRDTRILQAIRNRSVKVVAPDRVIPQGRTTDPEALLAKLDGVRGKTIAWADDPATEHRAHAMEHPFLRTLDGYQWLLMLAAHMERHTAQIAELKANPAFPRA